MSHYLRISFYGDNCGRSYRPFTDFSRALPMRRSILARFMLSFLLGIVMCLHTDFIRMVSLGRASEGTSDKTIDKCIADLGSDHFETREAAMRALKERVEALPALHKAQKSADLEVRHRVEEILTLLERKRALRGLSKVQALGKAGRAVAVADRLAIAAKCGVAGEDGWDCLTRFADQLITRTDRYLPPSLKSYYYRELPIGGFRRFAKQFNYKEIAQRTVEIDTGIDRDPRDLNRIAAIKFLRQNYGKLLLRGEEVSLLGRSPQFKFSSGMIASSGDVQISGVMCSVIVAGGDIKKVDRLTECIIICDGDVELLNGWEVRNSIIVARGRVTGKQGKLRDCLVRSGHTLHLPDEKTIDLKDGSPDPLAFVKFFELADVGIAAEDLPLRDKMHANGVRLKDVRKESQFAAGLRAGDVITAIEEKKTTTIEIFRRVLRRKLAEGGPLITFTVFRAGKTIEVPIPVKD